jgi:hypothetical protein
MTDLIRIKINQLKIGVPVEYDIFDSEGQLLLKRGAVITSPYQLLRFTAHGYCEEQEDTPPTNFNSHLVRPAGHHLNPFEVIEGCAFRLGRIFFNIVQGQQAEEEILQVCRDLDSACSTNPDATLGAVHLLHGHAYTTIHPIHTATMAHFLCAHLGMEERETLAILAAALTCNISILELQEVLQTQDGPLSSEQRDEIQHHPRMSVEMLKENGINNELWLTIVAQHHERINGTGYPIGLSANDIDYGAKIVAVADAYSAMISPRLYRETNLSRDALDQFMHGKGQEFDETLCRLLVKNMGSYSPGSFVELANNETAVVVRRTANGDCPIVASIKADDGSIYSMPVIRDTHVTEYAVRGMVKRIWEHKLDLSEIWGYEATPA